MKTRVAREPSRTAGRWFGEFRKSEFHHSGGPLDFDDSATPSRDAMKRLPVPLPTVPFRNQQVRQLVGFPVPPGGGPSTAATEGRTYKSGLRLGWVYGILALTTALLVALLPTLIGLTSDRGERVDVSVRSPLIEAPPPAPRIRRIENRWAIPQYIQNKSAQQVGSPEGGFVDVARSDPPSPEFPPNSKPEALPTVKSWQSAGNTVTKSGQSGGDARLPANRSARGTEPLLSGELTVTTTRARVDRLTERDQNEKQVDAAVVLKKKLAPPIILQTLDGQELKGSLRLNAQPVDLFHSDQAYISATQMIAARQQPARPLVIDPSTNRRISKLQTGLERAKVIAQKHPEQQDGVRQIEEKLASLVAQASQKQRLPRLEPFKEIVHRRDDLAGLPWTLGQECRMGEKAGSSMHEISRLMAGASSRLNPTDGVDLYPGQSPPSRSLIQQSLQRCRQLKDPSQAFSTMDQVLQVDYPALRMELIDELQQQGTEDALVLIANRAKYDLVAEVRQHATEALKQFPTESVREQLLEGLRYPWPAVALHSAEALARLDDQGAIPQLIDMLEAPDPRLPVKQNSGRYVARELVSINHLRNCLMCHAPSESPNDYGRSATPSILEPRPQRYYQPSTSEQGSGQGFVRADVTYLKQDFSVQQSVENPGPWPKVQRFDYVVRQRSMGRRKRNELNERIAREPSPYRNAIQYALRTLAE
jgi:hypothetical protein